MTDEFKQWQAQLWDKILILQEHDRINAKPVQSEFEEMIKKDVDLLVPAVYDMTWKQRVDHYWSSKLD